MFLNSLCGQKQKNTNSVMTPIIMNIIRNIKSQLRVLVPILMPTITINPIIASQSVSMGHVIVLTPMLNKLIRSNYPHIKVLTPFGTKVIRSFNIQFSPVV